MDERATDAVLMAGSVDRVIALPSIPAGKAGKSKTREKVGPGVGGNAGRGNQGIEFEDEQLQAEALKVCKILQGRKQ